METASETFTYEYLPRRGISKETHEFFGVKTQIDSTGKPVSVAYPHPLGYHQIKTVDRKDFWYIGENRGKSGGFCTNLFPAGSAQSITITEGFDDGMSAWQMLGKYPVYPVKSASSALSDVRHDYEYLNAFEKIYLCLDDDEPGQKAASQIASVFGPGKIYNVRLAPLKDATDYLEAGRGKDFKNIWWNAVRWMPEQVISSFKDVFAELDKHKDLVRYEWFAPGLQEKTGGIEEGRQIIITGLEGTGKTEIINQEVDYLLDKYPALNIGILLGEQPIDEFVKVTVAKRLKKPVQRAGHELPLEELKTHYKNIVQREDRVHIFRHVGSEDTEVITAMIRFMVAACGCKVVFFDNYQHFVTGRTKDRNTEALDYLAVALEALVKELRFALVSISHENDDELTRGSRNISKEADVWLNIKRNIGAAEEAERNTQHLLFKKNRQNQKTGPAVPLIYNPETTILSEVSMELPT